MVVAGRGGFAGRGGGGRGGGGSLFPTAMRESDAAWLGLAGPVICGLWHVSNAHAMYEGGMVGRGGPLVVT